MAMNAIQGGGGQQIDPQKFLELLAQALQKKGEGEGKDASASNAATPPQSGPAPAAAGTADESEAQSGAGPQTKQPEDMAGAQDIGASLAGV